MSERPPAAPDGLVVVDKPAGMTSHDVVARLRRLAHTRRVGHAGTLDPMATGVLVLGVGRATRLLGHLALAEKTYRATIRLGQATLTDDAEGEVVASTPAGHLRADDVAAALPALTGAILQVPSSVSAIKIGGQRAYKRVREGQDVLLPPRPVTVHAFEVGALRPAGPDGAESTVVDLDAVVTCSSGTYVRALARDLGSALGVGGHLVALRRTRVGAFDLDQAHPLDQLAAAADSPGGLPVVPLAQAARRAFPARQLTEEQAGVVRHGGRLPVSGLGEGPVAVFAPDGEFLALLVDAGGQAKPVAVFVG